VSRATKEYLATLDDAAFGAASEVTPKFVSPSDPAAQWTGAMRGPAFFAYADNYLVDVKSGIIVDVEASRAIRQAEVGAAKTMIERTEQRFDIKPKWLAADTAYGSGATLSWLVKDKKIAPHIPVIDKSNREDGTFSREDFSFDKERNVYTCPAGKVLTTTGKLVNDGETLLYLASTRDCRGCLFKTKCCPKTPFRRIPRSIYEEARDVVGLSPRPKLLNNRDTIESALRCYLPISSASCGLVVCDCVGRTVPSSSSHSPRSRRISAGLLSSSSDHHQPRRPASRKCCVVQ
jgi:hypothetical protein